jgi:hypothetical protein
VATDRLAKVASTTAVSPGQVVSETDCDTQRGPMSVSDNATTAYLSYDTTSSTWFLEIAINGSYQAYPRSAR